MRLAAICVDPPERSARVVEKHALPFSILSDSDRSIIRAYGLLHRGGSPEGADISLPATLVIGPDRTVRWRRVGARIEDRPYPQEVLEAVRYRLAP